DRAVGVEAVELGEVLGAPLVAEVLGGERGEGVADRHGDLVGDRDAQLLARLELARVIEAVLDHDVDLVAAVAVVLGGEELEGVAALHLVDGVGGVGALGGGGRRGGGDQGGGDERGGGRGGCG